MLDAEQIKMIQAAFGHYSQLRDKLDALADEHHNGNHLGPYATEEVIKIASEALTGVFFYLGVSSGVTNKELLGNKEMRIQRAYDAIRWVGWWAWWKDGTQYVGTTGRTYQEAKEEIAAAFGVTLKEIEEAYDRIDHSRTPSF